MPFSEIEVLLSDDEVFVGKMTLKEMKKHIFWNKQMSSNPVSVVNSPNKNLNTSVKILQTHSQPNLRSRRESCESDTSEYICSEWDSNIDSFVQMENMVEKLCVSSSSSDKPQLNNTLEIMEYILNNPPKNYEKEPEIVKTEVNENATNKDTPGHFIKSGEKNIISDKDISQEIPEPPQNTPAKTNIKQTSNQAVKQECYYTPKNMVQKPLFKTPGQTFSGKKPSGTSLKTPNKSNMYQHISSPVASYIRNCPIAPLVKDVHPRKPLPGPSSIPKLKNTLPVKASNKENINLPAVAYKSAKKTKVIDVPDKKRLPQCQWTKQLMTSLPRPVVIKHDHREMNLAKHKLMPQQEDSFADLSFHQAEVSVCMQKSAFKTTKTE